MPEVTYTYPLDGRPVVEAEVYGGWHPGELRGWWDRGGIRLMDIYGALGRLRP